MDRRTLLELTAAAALAGCGGRPGDGPGLKVVVAGAGICRRRSLPALRRSNSEFLPDQWNGLISKRPSSGATSSFSRS